MARTIIAAEELLRKRQHEEPAISHNSPSRGMMAAALTTLFGVEQAIVRTVD